MSEISNQLLLLNSDLKRRIALPEKTLLGKEGASEAL